MACSNKASRSCSGAIEAIQRLIPQSPHLPQMKGVGDPLLRGDIGEQRAGPLLVAAHPLSAVGPFSRGWMGFSAAS